MDGNILTLYVIPILALVIAVVGIFLSIRANKKSDASLEIARNAETRAGEVNHVDLRPTIDFQTGVLTFTNHGSGSACGLQGMMTVEDEEYPLSPTNLGPGESLTLAAPAAVKAYGDYRDMLKDRADRRQAWEQRTSPLEPDMRSFADVTGMMNPMESQCSVWWDLSWSTPAGNACRESDGRDTIEFPDSGL